MDAFPVQVTVDGRIHTSCRLRADGERLVVWEWDYQAREPRVVFAAGGSAVIDTVFPPMPPAVPWTWSLPEGDVVIAPQGGCGCGHPLKHRSSVPGLDPPAREHAAS